MSEESQITKSNVAGQIQQAYKVNLNLTILPARDIQSQLRSVCQPRKGAERTEKDPLDLPPPLRNWLIEANKQITAWLARDVSNQRAFIADPTAAMQQAGLQMDRATAKALHRVRAATDASAAVMPGLQLQTVKVAVGRGQIKCHPTGRDWAPPPLRADDQHDHDRDCVEGSN